MNDIIDNEFSKVGLYKHNAEAYRKVRDRFASGEKITSIVHATGTGKSYIALQLCLDNKDKEITYVVPSNAIKEHIESIIKNNPNLSEDDFKNLHIVTYQSLLSLSKEKVDKMPLDLFILDEFHHVGAPIWGRQIKKIVESHPNAQIFGMSAYAIRNKDSNAERDMTGEGELFEDSLVSTYSLAEAITDGVLPMPEYIYGHIDLLEQLEDIEDAIKESNNLSEHDKENLARIEILKVQAKKEESLSNLIRTNEEHKAKRLVEGAENAQSNLTNNIKLNGKYIYFCPAGSTNTAKSSEQSKIIDQEIAKVKEDLLASGLAEDDFVIYKTTSDAIDGEENRYAFYYDKDLNGKDSSKKLRIMFCINQYNEGVHAPGIDGVILGRSTMSDIIYFEQIGRALNVANDDDMPKILDFSGNYAFFAGLTDEIRKVTGERIKNGKPISQKMLAFYNHKYNIELDDTSLGFMEMLESLKKEYNVYNINERRWNRMYELAKKYYEHHGDLLIPARFKTINGYDKDENGRTLGSWIDTQRQNESPDSQRGQKLSEIGMVWNPYVEQWNKMYELAKKYYEHHHDLLITRSFKTINGYEKDENGVALGVWVRAQRQRENPNSARGKKLTEIGMVWKVRIMEWDDWYELAKKYYEHHHDLLINKNFKTINGYDEDKNGLALGDWIKNQRKNTSLTAEQKSKLNEIGMKWDVLNEVWNEMYELAKKYYEYHHDLLIPNSFKTNDGYTFDDNGEFNLGRWLLYQKNTLDPNSEKGQKLTEIGMMWKIQKRTSWDDWYELAKKYYEHHHNLLVPQHFRTFNGYDEDENGRTLGTWVSNQRIYTNPDSERGKKLLEIGMAWKVNEDKWYKMYELARKYYEHYHNLLVPDSFKTINGYDEDENGQALGIWVSSQRKNETPDSEKGQKMLAIGMTWEPYKDKWNEMYELAQKYYGHYHNLLVPQNFKTLDGYTYAENGQRLGDWISNQRFRLKDNLNDPRSNKLMQIGMIWNAKKNIDDIKNKCIECSIDYEINKDVLEHISLTEFISKINCLQDNNIPLVNNTSRKIHPIFSTSAIDMQKIYGISLEELIEKYYYAKEERNK